MVIRGLALPSVGQNTTRGRVRLPACPPDERRPASAELRQQIPHVDPGGFSAVKHYRHVLVGSVVRGLPIVGIGIRTGRVVVSLDTTVD